jgi:hypothetical protein
MGVLTPHPPGESPSKVVVTSDANASSSCPPRTGLVAGSRGLGADEARSAEREYQ